MARGNIIAKLKNIAAVLASFVIISGCTDSISAEQDASTKEEQSTNNSAAPLKKSTISIRLQSQFSPLFIADAPRGGGHPIGGPAYNFVTLANDMLRPLNAEITFHVTGAVSDWDTEHVQSPIVAFPDDFPTIHQAVASGSNAGGLDMGISLANIHGHPFGDLLVAGLPFGLEPDEFIAFLYEGGGLSLQQELYDEKFGGNVIVLPVAITPTQGGGWFSEPLPDPDTDENLTPQAAMKALCEQPIIVRWPEPGASIWSKACADVGVATDSIGAEARCADVTRPCSSNDNPITNDVESLTFGGFVFGGLPHKLALLNQIDAYELNTAYSDVLMMKIATDQAGVANADADLTNVIEKAPYLYGSTWHQPHSYVELLINRSFWKSLSEAQRNAIKGAAQASVTQNLAIMLDKQDEGIAILKQNGAIVLRWPNGLLDLLRAASHDYLDQQADQLTSEGDNSYERVLQSQRDYIATHQTYNDFGDINQGRSGAPTSPQ